MNRIKYDHQNQIFSVVNFKMLKNELLLELKNELTNLIREKSVKVIFFMGDTKNEIDFAYNFKKSLNFVESLDIVKGDTIQIQQTHLSHCKCKTILSKITKSILLKASRRRQDIPSQ